MMVARPLGAQLHLQQRYTEEQTVKMLKEVEATGIGAVVRPS
jgi:hypothetical protein